MICKDCVTKRIKRLRTTALVFIAFCLFMLFVGVVTGFSEPGRDFRIVYLSVVAWALICIMSLPILINPHRNKMYDRFYEGSMRLTIDFGTWWNERSAYSKRSLVLIWERIDG